LRAQRTDRDIRPPSKRKRGHQVEDQDGEIDVAEPEEDAVDGVGQWQQQRDREGDSPDQQGDDRPGDRDPKLRSGGGKQATKAGDAAEQPQGDSLDLHSLLGGAGRVTKLM
jgi:hypothetical protein